MVDVRLFDRRPLLPLLLVVDTETLIPVANSLVGIELPMCGKARPEHESV